MGWVAFVIAVLYVCLGFAVGTYLSRHGFIAAAKPPAPPADGQRSFILREDQAAEFIARIGELATNVDSGVGRHSSRVAEISRSLTGEQSLTASAAAAAAQLLEANQRLQQDLALAQAELKTQRVLLDSYMVESLTDALTGVGNRRKFDRELARRVGQWRSDATPLSLVLVDVDHFKGINDGHGHAAGDCVLQDLAQALAECVREMDVVARYGGEEFGMILPGTTAAEGCRIAEHVRSTIAGRAFHHRDEELLITLSAGVAEAMTGCTEEELTARADAALYAAKDGGRDCCYMHDGQNCVPIDKSARQGHGTRGPPQRIAPFIEGSFPESEMFYPVDCEELSPQGFTFLLPEEPAFDKVLWAAEGQNGAYASATVQSCRNIGDETSPLYRVSCRFTVPVHQLAEDSAS